MQSGRCQPCPEQRDGAIINVIVMGSISAVIFVFFYQLKKFLPMNIISIAIAYCQVVGRCVPAGNTAAAACPVPRSSWHSINTRRNDGLTHKPCRWFVALLQCQFVLLH